ncbi:MAG TPA: hypothetical protein VGG09_00860 [Acidimicrobiales bacterium]|jgi:hypothetical protein
MHTVRRTLMGVSAVGLAALLATATLTALAAPAGATSVPPQIPQVAVADSAATWIAGQAAPDGSIGGSLSSTVNAILALAAAHVDMPAAQAALSYVEANASSYITVDSADGPAQLAALILDAHAMGVDPTNFGGTNLVARLQATEQTSGPDAGLFGTETQLGDYYVGTYDQGLAFTALKAAGQAANAAAISWLTNQQCPSGGWAFPNQAIGVCAEDPSSFEGADDQTTSLAVQGLLAQGALTPGIAASALSFFTGGQDADGGWSYYPNSVALPQQTDSQSTGLVIQALLAMGQSPTSPSFSGSGTSPVGALLSFVVTSGSDKGALGYQDNSSGNLLATNQNVPVLAGLTYGFGPTDSYWVTTSTGAVEPFGSAKTYGSLTGTVLNKPIVGTASTLNGLGYWMVASDGGIFNYGDAGFFGSRGGQPLNEPIVGMAATPDGRGYWLVASDGGIFNYGDAGFFGSRGGQPLNAPIVGMAATADGGGYWLVASDGGIFSYGDAGFLGSRGGQPLNKPVVGMAATPDGGGYWLVASDGGIFSYGDAVFQGSTGSIVLNKPIVGMAATRDGGGYWLIAADGGVFNYGDALFSGSAASLGITAVGGTDSAS